MATYTDAIRTDKLPGIKKILKRYKPKLSRKKMLEENDVWIYDTSSKEDLDFAVNIIEKLPQFEEQKVVILVSDLRSWGKTPRKQKITRIRRESTVEVEHEEEEKSQKSEEKKDSDDENENEEKEENV